MPDCYLLAISAGSVLDRDTNNFTLFSLVEQIKIGGVPAEIPLEIHIHLEVEPANINQSIQLRFVFQKSDGTEVVSEPSTFTPSNIRYRIRTRGLTIPGYGWHKLRVQWRKNEDEDWKTFSAYWPLHVEPISEHEESSC